VSGCTSRPDRPAVFVETAPPGAACTLLRAGQPIATIAPTPGIGLVPPGAGEIAIECRRNGFRDAAIMVSARPGEAGVFEAAHDEYLPVSITLVPR
jgi:hypothetical protein